MNYLYNILSRGLYEKVRNYIENNNGSNKKMSKISLGIIGGVQLGSMLSSAAKKLNINKTFGTKNL